MPSPATILVVEDDLDLRDSLCGVFEDEGYRAIGVNDGREALAYLGANQAPCVILLDLMMSVMNGWEFLDFCRTDASLAKVPVVILSAVADQNVIAIDGAAAQLKKPISIEHVLEAVKANCSCN